MYTGKVWSHLEECGVEFCVLRRPWFIGEFRSNQKLVVNFKQLTTPLSTKELTFSSLVDRCCVHRSNEPQRERLSG
jgi:hypothetical protein